MQILLEVYAKGPTHIYPLGKQQHTDKPHQTPTAYLRAHASSVLLLSKRIPPTRCFLPRVWTSLVIGCQEAPAPPGPHASVPKVLGEILSFVDTNGSTFRLSNCPLLGPVIAFTFAVCPDAIYAFCKNNL